MSQVKFDETITFKTTDDHSKWGVSDENSDWICVGDINRAVRNFLFRIIYSSMKFIIAICFCFLVTQEMQTRRGGGSVCLRSKVISSNYRSLIDNFEPCKKP